MTANLPQQTAIPKLDDESEKRIAEIADYYFNDDGMGRYKCIKAMREYQLELAGLRAKVEAETIELCAKASCEHCRTGRSAVCGQHAVAYIKRGGDGGTMFVDCPAAAIRALQPLPKR